MVTAPTVEKCQRLLFATDLSARCDRALDRAAMLVKEWSANLTIVHAFESGIYAMTRDPRPAPSWRQDPNLKGTIAAKQLHQDLDQLDVPFDVVIQEGSPAEVIAQAVRDLGAGLIVTGIARGETFGRFIFGGTVDKLIRSSAVPVLVVKARPRHAYRDIVLATDFSDASRGAITATREMFPNGRITLLHCYESIPSGMMRLDAATDAGRQLAIREYTEFVNADSKSADNLSQLPILFERGTVDCVIQAYAADKPLDLLVIGSQGKNALSRALFGSTAEVMMASAPSDVLVVPPSGLD